MSDEIYWFKVRHDEWLGNTELRSCGLSARGLAIDIRCLMSKAPRRGYLETTSGSSTKSMDVKILAKLVGASPSQVRKYLQLLEENGVFKRDDAGTLYCPEMVKQVALSATRRETGGKGGNPALVKQKDNQAVKPTVESPQSTNHNESPSSPSVQVQAEAKPKDGTDDVGDRGMDIRPLFKSLAAKLTAHVGPELQSVLSYAKVKEYPLDVAERFHELNVSNGWKFPRTGKPIGNWQAALHNFVFPKPK